MKPSTLKVLLIAISLFAGAIPAQAQLESSDYDYSTEFIWGINKNTSGGLIGGFVIKYSRALNDRMYETFGLELMNVKNHKEVRYNSLITGNFFIWGKSNYLYALRPQYGRDYILFRKAPQQGVQITAISAAGPSIGIIAPYYIEYAAGTYTYIPQQYNPAKHDFQNIAGTGSLFQGVFQSKLTAGVNAKLGLSFEFGTFKSSVTGFEVGFLMDYYFKKPILVPNADNPSIFPTAYITLFYGSRR